MLHFDRILEVADPAVPLPIAITRRFGAFWATDLFRPRRKGFLGLFRWLGRGGGLRQGFSGLFGHVRKVGAGSGLNKEELAAQEDVRTGFVGANRGRTGGEPSGDRLEKPRTFTI